MTHEDAEAMRDELAESDPSATYIVAGDEAEGWKVVKIGVPTRVPTGSAQEAKPRPPQADDPRPPMWRDVGGPWAGGV